MNNPVSKRTLVKVILLVSLAYIILQVIICCANDRNLSMNFWLEHHNVKKLIEAGVPENSPYEPIFQTISDSHFWILRAGLIVTLFFAFYYKNKNQELYRLLLNIVISAVLILLLSSVVITWIIKIFTGKPRPDTLLEMYSHFSLSARFHSFPSGHTTETFSYIIPYLYFFRKYYLHVILLLYGFFASSTRIFLAHHFFTDVLFGIYITAVSGFIVCFIVEHREQKAKKIA